MKEQFEFYPPRRLGTFFHLGMMLILTAGSIWGFWQISTAEVAPELLPYLGLVLLSFLAIPFLVYHFYGLQRSRYILERGGIILQWGWRSETIAMDTINWVYRAEELEPSPKPPAIRWPGAVSGTRGIQRGSRVEFLASQTKGLVVISAGPNYFVISPAGVDNFLNTYQRMTELGSIEQLSPETFNPARFLQEIITQRFVQIITGSGLLLNVSLLVLTLRAIPRQDTISLGFDPFGIPYPAFGSVRLILFPIISGASFLVNLILGFFLYRNIENRPLSYLMWSSSVFISILFHLGLGYILL
jgi:hypothetical protein